MKLLIQRVKSAKVSVDGRTVGEINKGLFILFGAGKDDSEKMVDTLAEKLLNLRIMSDSEDKINLSIQDTKGEILVVSQFTLYADTSGGRRPSFINAAPPELARELYDKFITKLKENGLKIETGKFGTYMEIEPILDGPVTIVLEQ